MQINFSEFKKIIEQRQEILFKIKKEKNSEKRKELVKELISVENQILPEKIRLSDAKTRKKYIEMKTRNFLLEMKHVEAIDFFENEGFTVDFKLNVPNIIFTVLLSGDKYVSLTKDGKTYKPLSRKSFETTFDLDVLYKANYSKDWDKLFNSYPDLKEKLWEFVRQKNIKFHTNNANLIQKKIKEKQEELKNINNLQYVDKRTSELYLDIEELQKNKQRIEESQDMVIF